MVKNNAKQNKTKPKRFIFFVVEFRMVDAHGDKQNALTLTLALKP
jgi:hypothetical protein